MGGFLIRKGGGRQKSKKGGGRQKSKKLTSGGMLIWHWKVSTG